MTPLGQNLEDAVNEAKNEMKTYIDEKLEEAEDTNKKKILDLESSIR